ncbi:unnamed protein product, partial [Brassica rapa]
MSGRTRIDASAAYKKALEAMSTKKGSSSRTISEDGTTITGSSAWIKRRTIVKTEPISIAKGKKLR